MDAEVKGIGERITYEYQTAAERERMLRDALEAQKQVVDHLNASAVQSDILKREFETNRKLYEDLLQKQKEVGISASLKSSNIWIVVVLPDRRSGKTAETACGAEYSAKPRTFSAVRNLRWCMAVIRLGENRRKDYQHRGAGTVFVVTAGARCLAAAGSEEPERGAPRTRWRKRPRGSRIGKPPTTNVAGCGILQDCVDFTLAFAANSSQGYSGNERASRGGQDHSQYELGNSAGAAAQARTTSRC